MTTLSRRKFLAAGGCCVALSQGFASRAMAQEKALNLYAWDGYLDHQVLDDFRKAMGVTINLESYKSIGDMMDKMQSGNAHYDVVMQPGITLPQMLANGVYDPIIHTEYPSYAEIDPAITGLLEKWDHGNEHMVPYLWGTVGMGYDTAAVQERLPGADLNSLDIIFKPENAARLAGCGITLMDSPSTVIPMALRYLGKDGDSTNPDDYQEVVKLLRPLKPFIKDYDNEAFLNDLPNGKLCAANMRSSDFMMAEQRSSAAGVKSDLAYYVPGTGAPVWINGWCVPTSSTNKAEAKIFIGYMLQAEVLARTTKALGMASASLKAKELLDPATRENTAIYPTAELMKRIYAPKGLTPEQQDLMLKAWKDIRGQ